MPDPPLPLPASIATRVKECLGSFNAMLVGLDANEEYHSLSMAFSDASGRFKIWSSNIGAHHTGRRSLDYRLRDASHLQDHVLMLLSSLMENLKDAKDILSGEKVPWDQLQFSDSDSEDSDDEDIQSQSEQSQEHQHKTEMDQILEGIKESITNLLRLSASIRNPARHDQWLNFSKSLDTTPFEQYDISHVIEKYPSISASLARRLGTALSRRRCYFRYREEHHNKLATGLAGEEQDGKSTIASSLLDSQKVLAVNMPNTDDNASEGAFTATSFATSVADAARLRVPPLPQNAEYDNHFECPFCYDMIIARNRSAWKQHVYSDLQPYMCLREKCSLGRRMFSARHDWLQHEIEYHGKAWICYLGCPDPFTNRQNMREHYLKCHPGQTEGQIDQVLHASETRTMDTGPRKCALCDTMTTSIKAYAKHVGGHLRELSLFTLPSYTTDDPEDDDSGNESEEEEGVDPDEIRIGEQKQNAEQWDGVRLDVLAEAYMEVRSEVWRILGDEGVETHASETTDHIRLPDPLSGVDTPSSQPISELAAPASPSFYHKKFEQGLGKASAVSSDSSETDSVPNDVQSSLSLGDEETDDLAQRKETPIAIENRLDSYVYELTLGGHLGPPPSTRGFDKINSSSGDSRRSLGRSSSIDVSPASVEHLGLLPSTREFDKINSSSGDSSRYHGRSSSIDRSRDIPKYDFRPDAAPSRTSSFGHHTGPSLVKLMTQHKGPPMPMLASPLAETETAPYEGVGKDGQNVSTVKPMTRQKQIGEKLMEDAGMDDSGESYRTRVQLSEDGLLENETQSKKLQDNHDHLELEQASQRLREAEEKLRLDHAQRLLERNMELGQMKDSAALEEDEARTNYNEEYLKREYQQFEMDRREKLIKRKIELKYIKDRAERDKEEERIRRDEEHVKKAWKLKYEIQEEEKKEKQEKELEEEMRKRLVDFGFQDNQIQAMIDNEDDAKLQQALTHSDSMRLAAPPTYVKVRKEHLEVETLLYYDLPYEVDSVNPEYLIILREMEPRETDILFEHTRRLRLGLPTTFPEKNHETGNR